ncbi:MAG: DNA polymerase III subunit beta [Candidatus Nomurabacteria bacterium]|jgi:DNA polymerase-3 subunit beta|nr:DNA polymerase III subunit beta [Candidatus Nomurabacteria bacterium]
MELEISQEKLEKALSITNKIAGSKTILPILNNILLRTDKNNLIVTSTNLEIASQEYLSANIKKQGVITVPSKILTEFVANLPEGQVKLVEKNHQLQVSSGNYKSTIIGMLADEFPELPTLDEKVAVDFEVAVDDFEDAVSGVVIAASNDTTRPSITGVYFNSFKGELFVAATDGYRLSEKKLLNKIDSEIKVIIPVAALQEVLRSVDKETEKIKILIDDSQVKFQFGLVEITSKLINGSFPDYRQLMPKENDINLVLDKDEMVRVVKLAGLFSRDSGGTITIETNKQENKVSIKSVASEIGENSSDIKTEVEMDGKVSLNSKFILDALNVISEEKVRVGFSDKVKPVVIKNAASDNYVHIIMPIQS